MADKIFELIDKEKQRQRETLMMIPSENYTYPEVMEAVGSVLMQKYAEGYPKRRYYQGNEVVDEIEELCRSRALEAFDLDSEKYHVNVQPHSGCEANLAVYNTILMPGDRIMAMYLPDGGHLSHGWQWKGEKTTFVSKIFETEFYHVDPSTNLFDYDAIEKQAMEFKPKLIISGGTAYPREIDYKRMAEIAKKVGAYYLADIAHEAGLIAAGVCRSPFEYADFVSMTTHKTLRGPRGAIVICKKELGHQLDMAIMPGLQGGPHLHSIAGIAVALEKTKTDEFRTYAKQTVANAAALAKCLMDKGLEVVSGGTDKHLVLLDLRERDGAADGELRAAFAEATSSRGWFVAWALEYAGIIMNRNTVPNDTGSPFYPSGLRMGTPAITVRGMKEGEMEIIANWMMEIIGIINEWGGGIYATRTEGLNENIIPEDPEERKALLANFKKEMQENKRIGEIREDVKEMCKKFPVWF